MMLLDEITYYLVLIYFYLMGKVPLLGYRRADLASFCI